MLLRAKRSLESQLLLFAMLLMLAFGLSCILPVRPRLLFGLKAALIGVAGGAAVVVFALLVCAVFFLRGKRQGREMSRHFLSAEGEMAFPVAVGKAMVAASEELLFRGLVFGSLLRVSVFAALPVNFVLIYGAYFQPRKPQSVPIFEAGAGMIYALLYFWSHSLFAAFLAHFTADLALWALFMLHSRYLRPGG